MSILINGMEMPKTESEVLIIAIKSDGSVYPVRIDGDGQPIIFPNEEMKNCAIPVPPHGRLIDKDVMCNECRRIAEEYDGIYPDCTYCPAHLAPTIIPADGKDTDAHTREEDE